jgi:hypothetical protein
MLTYINKSSKSSYAKLKGSLSKVRHLTYFKPKFTSCRMEDLNKSQNGKILKYCLKNSRNTPKSNAEIPNQSLFFRKPKDLNLSSYRRHTGEYLPNRDYFVLNSNSTAKQQLMGLIKTRVKELIK